METSVSNFINVAVIGYGWWGKTIVHTLNKNKWIKVVAVVEPEAAVRKGAQTDAYSMEFSLHDNFEEILAIKTIDAVILCTPHKQHAQQIIASAQAGKHVFCEKPLCLTLEDAKAAIAVCEQNDRVLGIGHERRFEPAMIRLRQDIAAGKLGTILQIEANFSQDKFFALPKNNWRLSNQHAPVGPLSATGIHLVDLSIAVLGGADSVWARLATRGSDFENGDTLGVMLGFPGGANAMISAMLATPFEGRFAVYGSLGWVEIRDRTHPENPTGWDVTTALKDQVRQTEFFEPYPVVRANLEAFAQAVLGISTYPVTHKEMLENVAALEAIINSVNKLSIQDISID